MQTQPNDVTNQEILEAVNNFATKTEERFTHIETDIKEMKRTMTTLATKDFVAEENAKLRGDIIITMRKEDSKLRELVTILREKDVLNDSDVKRLVTLEPFPQLVL